MHRRVVLWRETDAEPQHAHRLVLQPQVRVHHPHIRLPLRAAVCPLDDADWGQAFEDVVTGLGLGLWNDETQCDFAVGGNRTVGDGGCRVDLSGARSSLEGPKGLLLRRATR